MKKRIIPLMTVLCLLLCLLPSAAFAAETGGTVDTSRSYNFELTAERGQTEVKAAPGDIITVSLVLRRTDSAETAKMYGMQTEIEYDDTFLQLVESSVMTASGVRWNDLGRRTGGRAFYLNFVSFKGGESWEPEVLVGSFQMKVLGTSGGSSLTPVNTMVPTQDGMGRYAAEDNAVTVIPASTPTSRRSPCGSSCGRMRPATRRSIPRTPLRLSTILSKSGRISCFPSLPGGEAIRRILGVYHCPPTRGTMVRIQTDFWGISV